MRDGRSGRGGAVMGGRTTALRARETAGITPMREWYLRPAIHIQSSFVLHPLCPSFPGSPLPFPAPPLRSILTIVVWTPVSTALPIYILLSPRPIHVHFCHQTHHLIFRPPLLPLFARLLPYISPRRRRCFLVQITSAWALISLLRTFHLPARSSSPIFQSVQGWKDVQLVHLCLAPGDRCCYWARRRPLCRRRVERFYSHIFPCPTSATDILRHHSPHLLCLSSLYLMLFHLLLMSRTSQNSRRRIPYVRARCIRRHQRHPLSNGPPPSPPFRIGTSLRFTPPRRMITACPLARGWIHVVSIARITWRGARGARQARVGSMGTRAAGQRVPRVTTR
ncbi:hypothetical protein B0H11DRAFT_50036 [Mycena galericulata]|nr:hypothetical protein B0H11DRAFT_50036 [Mycena galericulata]